MASTRFGHLDDFTLKNTNVGIGTSTPQDKMEVIGETRSQDLNVTGIATLTSPRGFIEKHTGFTDNVNMTAGDSGTLSGEIVVGSGLTMTVGTAATTSQGTVDALKVYDMFQPPSGTTNQRPPAKPGSLFYNFDFKTIEFFDGNSWRQVDNTTTRGRGICCGGETNKIDINYFNIQTRGDAKDFGDLTAERGNPGAVSSGIRGIIAGGEPATDLIQYFTIASQGNAIDFDGNLTASRRFPTGCSSSTRGLFMGGSEPSRVNKIDFIEMATAGVDAADFGDLTEAKDSGGGGAWSNGIRGGVMGGYPNTSTIEVLTIASKGNATKFGNTLGEGHNIASTSNHVRAIGGGGNVTSVVSTIQYITMASDGNATYFGDLSLGRSGANACSSRTRSVISGGNDGTNPRVNTMDYVEIATTGNAIDFGDLQYKPQSPAALSDSHGGLGGF